MKLSSSPSVSVVIPTLNEGAWLRRTVESVIATSKNYAFEIQVVDDGSTDGSYQFLESTYWSNASVTLFKKRGLGVSRARNFGALMARGEVLVFIDAHVIPDAKWLDELVRLLNDPSVGLVGLAVRNLEKPNHVGYGYVFLDENLRSGWLPKKSDVPFEIHVW